jgi:hypothetical protein
MQSSRILSFFGVGAVLGVIALVSPVTRVLAQHEAQKLTERLLAAPKLKAEVGFSVTIFIPPGQLYDPL